MTDESVRQSWEEFLNPEVLRDKLINASVFIAAFEILKTSVIGRIRDFFTVDFRPSGDTIDPKYASEVLSLNKSPVYASFAWLESMDAIEGSDIEVFGRVKECRNHLAHDLWSVVASKGLPADFASRFAEMVELLRKIEVWWIVNVEIATDPDLVDKEIDEDGIVPGPVWMMRLLCDIALSDGEQSRLYHNEFRKWTGAATREVSDAQSDASHDREQNQTTDPGDGPQ